MKGVTEGRIVHFVLETGNSVGEHRPAIIVNSWPNISQYQTEGRVNLTVFPDWGNDGAEFNEGLSWRTSIPYSEEKTPGTWHWIEPA